MSKVAITDTYLTNIANAIRTKSESSDTYTPSEMASAILDIPSESGGVYEVNSVEEMEDLTEMSENDYCVVKGSTFPSGYTQLEYLQSSGTQYIDTEYKPYKTTLELKFQKTTAPTADEMYAGSWNPNNNRYNTIGYTIAEQRFVTFNRSNTMTQVATFNTNINTIVYNNTSNKMLYNGVEKATVSNLTTQATYSLYLFGRHSDTGLVAPASVRIYYAKITDKDTGNLVRNMIPCKRNSDNVLGMYDLVNDVFYTNAGTGSFTGGNEIENPYYTIYQYRSSAWVQVGEEYLYPSTTVTPTTSQQTVPIPENYMGLKEVIVSAVTSNIDANIQAGNIKKDITILGVTGTLEGGSDLDWATLGYNEIPSGIQDAYDYAVYIKNNWVSSVSMQNKFANDLRLTIMPLVDTSSTTSMQGAFSGCTNLMNIPLLDTSNVTNMYQMFNNCSNLMSIPLLNTPNVTTMRYMFYNCSRLTSIPLLDTSNVENMQGTFSGCTNLTTVPQLNLSEVINIQYMFSNCSNLSDESLNNILKMCININPSYTTNKTLARMGFNSTDYPTSRIQALTEYQNFINAGWTIGY